jgi:hypothetical protein
LKALRLSCVNINADLKNLVHERHRYSTPLTTLRLVECNINHQGLAAILSIPKALARLDLSTSSGGCVCFSSHLRFLGEGYENTSHFELPVSPCHNFLFYDHAAETMAALKQQKHSLETILYAGAMSETTPNRRTRQSADVIDGAFSDFLALQKIRLVRPCDTLERAIMTVSPPPNLKILDYTSDLPFIVPGNHPINFMDDRFDYALPDEILRIPFFHVPKVTVPPLLRALTVTIEHVDDYDILELISLRLFIQKAGQQLLKQGVSLTVMASDTTGYYPPYLYGEEPPHDMFVYSAFRNVGWFDKSFKVEVDENGRPVPSAFVPSTFEEAVLPVMI